MPALSDPVWAELTKPLELDLSAKVDGPADVAIVGGGIMGLASALHAARAGMKVHVLEAGRIGDGASGLNGGQVIPGLKYDPDWLIRSFGDRRGEAMVRFAAGTADSVFDLIRDENLDVPHNRNGWIQACHTERSLVAAELRFKQWAARGAEVAMLDEQGIAKLIGTGNYHGGFLDRRAGVINPLAYTFELARVAREAGAAITERAECRKLEKRPDGWLLSFSDGREMRAKYVIVATNAYSGSLIPRLSRSLVALHSFQIATEPLSEHVMRDILPQGQAVSDSRRILVYFRKTPDRRLILGGRGPMRRPTHSDDWSHLERALERLFPSLADAVIEKRWYGRVAMTPDHLPHLHEPEKGLLTFVGCNGRGLGLMTAISKCLVGYLQSGDPTAMPFPITPIKPIPFHFLRNLGVAAMIGWYRMLDAVEQ